MAPLGPPGGGDGAGDRAGHRVAVARWGRHPGPAAGGRGRIASNQRALLDHTGSTAGHRRQGVPAALANLTAVITTARQQGTADQQAEDLLDQAADLANARPAGRKDDSKGDNKDEGQGKGVGKGQEAAKRLAELQRTVDELIGQGKIRPRPPRSNRPWPSWPRPCSRQAEPRLPARHLERPNPGSSTCERGLAAAGSGRPAAQPGLTGSTRRPGRVRLLTTEVPSVLFAA